MTMSAALAAVQLNFSAATQPLPGTAAEGSPQSSAVSVFIPDLREFLPAPAAKPVEYALACTPTRPMRADSQIVRIRLSGAIPDSRAWTKRPFKHTGTGVDGDCISPAGVGNPVAGTATSEIARRLEEGIQEVSPESMPRVDSMKSRKWPTSSARIRAAGLATLDADPKACVRSY